MSSSGDLDNQSSVTSDLLEDISIDQSLGDSEDDNERQPSQLKLPMPQVSPLGAVKQPAFKDSAKLLLIPESKHLLGFDQLTPMSNQRLKSAALHRQASSGER